MQETPTYWWLVRNIENDPHIHPVSSIIYCHIPYNKASENLTDNLMSAAGVRLPALCRSLVPRRCHRRATANVLRA